MWGSTRGARTSWTAKTTTATDVEAALKRPSVWYVASGVSRTIVVLVALCAAASIAAAQSVRQDAPSRQGVRSHTRLDPRGTKVTQSQAETLTLTLGAADVRLLQTWVRSAGTIDKTGK